MKRKVVQHGKNTLTISLPTDWVKRNRIKIGQELEVTDKLTKLEVGKEKEEDKKEIIVEIKDLNEHIIKRIVGNLYRKGYDSITLRFSDEKIKQKALDAVTSFLEQCIGLEIISHDGKNIHAKAVASLREDEFQNVLRRYFLLSLQVVEAFSDAMKEEKLSLLQKVLEIEIKQNTLYLYTTRVLNKTQHLSKEEVIFYYLLIERLEEVCDEYRDMAIYLLEKETATAEKEFLCSLEEAAAYLRLVYELYYSFDENKIPHITVKRKHFAELQKKIFENKKPFEIPLYHHLCTALVKMYETSSPIIGLHLGTRVS